MAVIMMRKSKRGDVTNLFLSEVFGFTVPRTNFPRKELNTKATLLGQEDLITDPNQYFDEHNPDTASKVWPKLTDKTEIISGIQTVYTGTTGVQSTPEADSIFVGVSITKQML